MKRKGRGSKMPPHLSYFLATNNGNRSCVTTKLLSCLYKCVRSCRRSTIRSYEKHNLLTGVAAMGDAFISFHKISPIFISLCYDIGLYSHCDTSQSMVLSRHLQQRFNLIRSQSCAEPYSIKRSKQIFC